jgi:hypothetical protein
VEEPLSKWDALKILYQPLEQKKWIPASAITMWGLSLSKGLGNWTGYRAISPNRCDLSYPRYFFFRVFILAKQPPKQATDFKGRAVILTWPF